VNGVPFTAASIFGHYWIKGQQFPGSNGAEQVATLAEAAAALVEASSLVVISSARRLKRTALALERLSASFGCGSCLPLPLSLVLAGRIS
jgi:hypothetical protein